jgi:hypothetical protein
VIVLPRWIRQSRGRRVGIFLVVLASVFLGAGCHRAPEPVRRFAIEHEITPEPVRVGLVTVTFTLTDAGSQTVPGARLTLEADMSHAGMSPVFADAKEIAPGRYQAQLELGMAGDWVILLHGSLPGGLKLEEQFDVRDVRPN